MKTNYLFLAFSIVALTIASCSNEVDEVLDAHDEQMASLDNVFSYDMYFDAEINSYDGTTRAITSNDWKDGDVVYFYLKGGNNAYGKAEYISSSQKWRVTCTKTLESISDADCYVWFSVGNNPSTSTASYGACLSYTYISEAYNSSGIYTFSNNTIYINVTLEPKFWRLRFNGPVGTMISLYPDDLTIYRIMYLENLHTQPFSYYTYQSYINLTVNNDGFTDYFVGGARSSCTKIKILDSTTGIAYYHAFDVNTLKAGESGCFTIPTSSDLHGWTKE